MQRQPPVGYPSRDYQATTHLLTAAFTIMPAIQFTRLIIGATDSNKPLLDLLAAFLAMVSSLQLRRALQNDFAAQDLPAVIQSAQQSMQEVGTSSSILCLFPSREAVARSHGATMMNVGFIAMALTVVAIRQDDTILICLAALWILRLCGGDLVRATLRDFDADTSVVAIRPRAPGQ